MLSEGEVSLTFSTAALSLVEKSEILRLRFAPLRMTKKKRWLALAVILALAGCREKQVRQPRDSEAPVEVLLPEHGAYTGAFMDFGDAEDDVTLEMIEEFENMVGKHQAI